VAFNTHWKDGAMAKKALIFENDKGMSRELVTALAIFSDTQVLDVARTPAHALRLLDKHRHDWDVVVFDLASMAHMSKVVLQACQNRLAHQHVLVLSKEEALDVRIHCAALGADFVFSKDTELGDFFIACNGLEGASDRAVIPGESPGAAHEAGQQHASDRF
jgi:two-component system OmpR family response regulator